MPELHCWVGRDPRLATYAANGKLPHQMKTWGDGRSSALYCKAACQHRRFPSRETSWAGSRHGRLVWSVQFMHPHNIVACDINNTYFHNPKGGFQNPWNPPQATSLQSMLQGGTKFMHSQYIRWNNAWIRNSTFESVSHLFRIMW